MMNSRRYGFYGYLLPHWTLAAMVLLLSGISASLLAISPFFAKLTIDNAYGKKDIGMFFIYASIGVVLFLASSLLDFARTNISRLLNRKVYFDLSADLFKHIQLLHYGFHANRSSGEYIYRVRNDTEAITSFLCDQIPRLPVILLRFLITIAAIFYLNWKLALLTLMLVPVSYAHSYLTVKWMKGTSKARLTALQQLFKVLHESFSHIHLIKSFGSERGEAERYEAILNDVVAAEIRDTKTSSIFSLFGVVLNRAMSGVIILYGVYQIIRQEMTFGSLAAIAIYVAQVLGILKSMYDFYQGVVINKVTRDRVNDILAVRPAIVDSPDSIGHIFTEGVIELRGVSFRYRKESIVLKDLEFRVMPRSKVALVGRSGSGKTTILSLISRLYDPEKGSVVIDGVDIKKIKLEKLKSQMGIALQQAYLWNDTIANNILYGGKGAGMEDAIKAARIAEAHKFIMNLKDGYNTIIGEAGGCLSEGQKQRVAIARAIIARPRILILDEAMSSLDSETEDKVIDNIMREFKDSTIIVVSHRLSTVEKMETVYLLMNGSIIESGTHEALLNRDPRYNELFSTQIKGEIYECS
jgi:ABC-type bacteriocin/lantibiotic exporter with double-glycine peptidase domain